MFLFYTKFFSQGSSHYGKVLFLLNYANSYTLLLFSMKSSHEVGRAESEEEEEEKAGDENEDVAEEKEVRGRGSRGGARGRRSRGSGRARATRN